MALFLALYILIIVTDIREIDFFTGIQVFIQGPVAQDTIL